MLIVRLNHRSIQIFTDGSAIDNPGGRGGEMENISKRLRKANIPKVASIRVSP